MKLLIMRFSPASDYFLSLRTKYSPEYAILKHPQSMLYQVCSLYSASTRYETRSPKLIQTHRAVLTIFICFNFLKTNILLSLTYYFISTRDNIGKFRCIKLSQCNDFEHVLEPDDGHIGLKHVVRKRTVNCECVKVTDNYQLRTVVFPASERPRFTATQKTDSGYSLVYFILYTFRFNFLSRKVKLAVLTFVLPLELYLNIVFQILYIGLLVNY
jgi:hypothetical protein